jgi:hypothetical protein
VASLCRVNISLASPSPLANAHVIPSGTYHFERAAAGR